MKTKMENFHATAIVLQTGWPCTVVSYLKKALYGLKEPSRQQGTKSNKVLPDGPGLIMSSADDCFHVKQSAIYILTVEHYVYDLLIACTDRKMGNKEMELFKTF